MKRLIILFTLILPLWGCCQSYFPKSGIKAPAIKVDEWVNKNITQGDLSGKTIVIEFWFIHCAPCVAAMPHLNKVAEKYKNDNVVFLAITHDRKEAVEKFLSKMYMASSVGTDTQQATIQAFEVIMFPTTIIVDTNGMIAWAGFPFELEAVLDTLIKNHADYLNEKIDSETAKKKPSYQLDVKIHNLEMGTVSYSRNGKEELVIVNKTIKEIIAEQMEVSDMRIDITGKYFDKPLDITYKIDSNATKLSNNKEALLYHLQKKLNIQINKTRREANIWTMRLKNDSLISQYKSNQKESGISSDGKERRGNDISIDQLVNMLEDEFNILIEHGIPLKDNYNYNFPTGNFEEAVKILEDKYGFEFYQTKRKTDFVNIDFTNMKMDLLIK